MKIFPAACSAFSFKINVICSNIRCLLSQKKKMVKVQITSVFAPRVHCSNHDNRSETCKPMQSTGSSERFKLASCKNVILLKIRNFYVSLCTVFLYHYPQFHMIMITPLRDLSYSTFPASLMDHGHRHKS